MTVRQRIDQLAAEPPVGDLGYAADQRLVASALLGLQLLADEIDALKAGSPIAPQGGPPPAQGDTDTADGAVIADIVAQLQYLSEQVVRLTAAVKASVDLPQIAHLADQVADLTAVVKGGGPDGADGEFDDADDDEPEDEVYAEDADEADDLDGEDVKKRKKKKKKDKKRAKNFILE